MASGPSRGFPQLHVSSMEDAEVLVSVLRRYLGSRHRGLSILHLPCSVCEWVGLITQVGGPEALLRRLPAGSRELLLIHQKLAGGLWSIRFQTGNYLAAADTLGYNYWGSVSDMVDEESAFGAFMSQTLQGGPHLFAVVVVVLSLCLGGRGGTVPLCFVDLVVEFETLLTTMMFVMRPWAPT